MVEPPPAGLSPPTTLFLTIRNGGPSAGHARPRLLLPPLVRGGHDGTGHWLRHTFAMTMLVRLQHQARTTPEY